MPIHELKSTLLNTYDDTCRLVDEQIERFKQRKQTMERIGFHASDIHITSTNSDLASTDRLGGTPSGQYLPISSHEIKFGDELETQFQQNNDFKLKTSDLFVSINKFVKQ